MIWKANNYTGILLFLAAIACGSASGGLSKLLVRDMPAPLILWGRFAVNAVIISLFSIACERQTLRWPRQPLLLILRGLFLTGSAAGMIVAMSDMPLANTTAIIFIYPFLIVAVAPFALKERVSGKSWIVVIFGFFGVLIVLRPGSDGYGWYGIAAMLGGISYGFHLLVTRGVAAYTPPLVTAIWTSVVSVVFFTGALPFTWQSMNTTQLTLLFLLGSLTAASQLFMILACTRTEISTLAPFGYTEIIGAAMFGFLFFHDLPDVLTWIGIAIIILSGVYLAITVSSKLPLVSRSRPPG